MPPPSGSVANAQVNQADAEFEEHGSENAPDFDKTIAHLEGA